MECKKVNQRPLNLVLWVCSVSRENWSAVREITATTPALFESAMTPPRGNAMIRPLEAAERIGFWGPGRVGPEAPGGEKKETRAR